MKHKLENTIKKYNSITDQLADPKIISDPNQLKALAKEYSKIEPVAKLGKEYIDIVDQIDDNKSVLMDDDAELIEIAREEMTDLDRKKSELEEKLKTLLLPKNPNDNKNLILEIRAGTGGDEAALFAADLFRLYCHFAERNNWTKKLLASNEIGIGGFKEIIVALDGKGAYGMMKYESGVHRVQRVPETETSGRVHTSAATVAVLPEAKDVDVEINDLDLKIDTYRASGAGGQHVNKTESAIRITHLPTGLVVTCQDESSQHKNKAAALKVLRSRLMDFEIEKINKKRSAARKKMVSSGDRSAKIRTYNFPQGRVTDHRINLTLYKLDAILDGGLEEFIEKIKLEDQKLQLSELEN